MTFNASDRKQVRRAEKASDLADRNRIAYIRHIMSDPFGRAWMHSLLAAGGMFQESFVPASFAATAFNLGRTAIVKPIWADVFQHCPDQYVLMMQEQSEKEAANARRSADDADDTAAATAGPEQDSGRDDRRPSFADDDGYDPAEAVDEHGFFHRPN